MKKKTSSHVKIGDKVKVISGNQKGFIGVIASLITKKSVVILDGITPRIKFVKNPQGEDSKKVEIQIPIHTSNVMLWDKDANVASKIGYKVVNEKKVRYFKKSGNIVQ
jgi:large subunit ribosomal protein L24